MSGTTLHSVPGAITRLDWESDHFGFEAARLEPHDLDDAQLAASLSLARGKGIHLLVWPAAADRLVPETLVDEFAGALVDRKATFQRTLAAAPDQTEPGPAGPICVVPYRGPSASAALIELAIAAGAFSRFKLDRRIPREKFAAMYRLWIERSVSGELADVVLVATPAGCTEEASPAGMITLAGSDGSATIGLVAVAAEFRAQGIGAALIEAAHRWMRRRGAREASVVTQQANVPACRLYERSGYRLAQRQHYYHFWPQAEPLAL